MDLFLFISFDKSEKGQSPKMLSRQHHIAWSYRTVFEKQLCPDERGVYCHSLFCTILTEKGLFAINKHAAVAVADEAISFVTFAFLTFIVVLFSIIHLLCYSPFLALFSCLSVRSTIVVVFCLCSPQLLFFRHPLSFFWRLFLSNKTKQKYSQTRC